MSVTETVEATEWIESNQRAVGAELDRIERRLDGDDDGRTRTPGFGETTIDTLADRFGLSPFALDVLLLCAGAEMRTSIAERCATSGLTDGRPCATFSLALSVLAEPTWADIGPTAPLRYWRLVDVVGDGPLATSQLRIDERVLHFLAGVNRIDTRLRRLVRSCAVSQRLTPRQREVAERVGSIVNTRLPPSTVQLVGDDRDGVEAVVAEVAAANQQRALVLDGSNVPLDADGLDSFLRLWGREQRLLDGLLLVETDGDRAPLPLLDAVTGPVIVSAPSPLRLRRPAHVVVLDRPSPAEQRALWLDALPETDDRERVARRLAAQFRLSGQDIERAALIVAEVPAPLVGAAAWEACQGLQSTDGAGFVDVVTTRWTWDDLVLPDATMAPLQQIAAHAEHRFTVDEEWGFARRSGALGLSALFAGDSGTGKTMAAEVLANALQVGLLRVDLASVVSKYIGETEKNLAKVFDAAEATGAILLFDEADALFGRRSEVRDSHDRYANIEVSYLLQRMEAHRGLAILTTNHEQAIDPAFQRRLRYIVRFPFPDRPHRAAMWRRAFPDAAPVGDIDVDKLSRLSVSGGSIRNIALTAAHLAAAGEGRIGMHELLEAARLDAAKREQPVTTAETRGWV